MSTDSTHRTHPRAQLLIRPILALALAALSLPLASASAYADDVTDPAVAEAQLQATASEEQTSEPVEETPPETDPEPVEPAPDLTTDETPPEPPAPADEEPAPEETVAEPPPSSTPKKTTQQLQVEPQAVLAEPDCTVTGFSQNTQENSGGSWINGALNKNNSDYAEGDFVPQKVDLKGLVPGTYTIGFTFDRLHNDKYAYDYVADLAISGSTGATATWSSSTADFDGPAPTTAVATVAVTITFTITDATDPTATITWGGHIASELDYGPGSSAGFINGAPYHFALSSTTGAFGCSTGNRDNQLMADAVDFATITVVKDAQPNSSQPFGFSIAAPNDLDADFDLVDNGTGQQSVTYNVPPGTTTITETPVEGWNLASITCTPIAGTVTSPSVSLTLVDDNNVTCTFVNARTASLEVDKLWVINGGDPVAEGAEPAHLGLGAQLKVDGVDKAWDTQHGGYLQGSTVSLSEQVTFGNGLCDWAGAPGGRLTSANGTATDAPLPHDATLAGGANTYAITNAVTCDGALVLRKDVQNTNGGTAEPGDFTLIATPDAGPALSTPGSEAGTRYVVPAGSSYDLSEGTLPAGYSLAGIDCGSGSTTTVTVPAGRTVTCTFTNVDSPGSLTLDKIVEDNGTGDLTPASRWRLSAMPVGIDDQPTIEGDGDASGATKAGLYLLDEEGPDTHTEGDWSCRTSAGAPVPVVLDMVSVGVGANVICEITNTAIAPTLTLVKALERNGTGDTTPAIAWTLTATPDDAIVGQDPVTGMGKTAKETVKVGDYALSETGPSSYQMTPEGWTCVDGAGPVDVTDDEVQVGLAQDVVCTVTNVAVPSSWMVEKSSDPASGTVMPGDPIHYTITVTKVGDGVPVRDFEVTDTLTGIDPSWVSNLVTDTGSADLGDDGVITWSVDVLGDTPLTMTYSVTVGADAWGATLRNVVTPGPEPCIPPAPDVPCDETTHVTPHHTLDKSVEHLATPGDGDDLVEPGERLRYTLTVVNDTELANLDTVIIDNVADVLDNARMVTSADDLDAQGAVLDVDETTLTWTITGLAPGASIQLTYVVQVDEGAWGTTLRNVATPGDSGECIPPDDARECTTTTPTPGLLTLVKDVEPNGTGDETQATAWHLSATPDEIAGQATIAGDGFASGAIRAGSYQLAEDGPATHRAGDWKCLDAKEEPVTVSETDVIQLGAQDVVTCRITNTAIVPRLTLIKVVDPGDTGDGTQEKEFTLTATPQGIAGQQTLSGPGPKVSDDVRVGTYLLSEAGPSTHAQGTWSCVDGTGTVPVTDDRVQVGLAQDVECTITNTAIPSSWRVAKTSNPPSGSTVMPGQVINYTITVTKVGDGVPVRNIQVVDTLTGIDTTVATGWVTNLLADTGEALLGETGLLTWTIDELGATPLKLTYSVRVGDDAWNSTLHNAVTPGPEPCIPPAPGIPCDETTHFTPHHTLDKSVEHLATPGDGDDLVEPGERLRYTLTVVNDTTNANLDTVITDNVANVLDNARMVTSADDLKAQGAVLDVDETTLTWTIAGLAPGASIQLTYVVQVDEGAWDTTLRNVATPGDSGECIPPDDARECTTTTVTPPVTTMVVEKRDLETDEVLAGATFQLYADEDNARDENGDCTFASPPVVGAGDQLLGTAVTGTGGQALFTDLQHGCYLLVETAAPPGYALPENAVMGIEIDEDNFVRGGLMSPIVVTDFAEGLLAIVAKQQFELIDGEWVESDGVIDFGEQVKYVVRIEATGPKNFHDVEVSDYVPGWNPDDVTSTDRAVLVPGSAACAEGLACTVSVDPATQLITWDLGDLAPDLGETIGGTTEFVVEFPDAPPLEAGESAEDTLWNVGFLDYAEVVGILPEARAGHGRARTAGAFEMVQHRLVSNEVVISAFLELPPPAGTPPENPPPPPAPPGPDLPETGSPAGLGTMALLGGVMVGLGLLLSRRRRED